MGASVTDVDAIFCAAIELTSPAERADYVSRACGQDTDLLRRVEELLVAHFAAGSFLESPPTTIQRPSEPTIQEGPGTVIGPYRLLEQIGEGGMGVVFMAEQTRPVHRKAALKIIKPGMDSRQVIGRFEAERQALALMDHPNIARVFDAGTSDTGRPYFVMELVKGVSIIQYCDEHRLTPALRLELFIAVCQAVQHAHQKGIIHRDLKPTNVLVAEYDERPVPKIIDFGVAKAVGQQLTEKTLFTEFGQVVGTIEYMSPEQAKLNQLDIDTRTDIYSLGVLLYELLTGSTPFDKRELRSAAFDEMLRTIREVEPPKPSTRLSSSDALPTIAANRGLEPKKLTGLVRGDLDWIALKALEKDRSRRYETASSLAADVQRYLSDELVAARPPTRAYRLRKFVERNKLAVVATAAVLVALMMGTIGATIGLIGEARQRAAAEAAKEELQAVNEFLTDDLLGAAEPSRLPDKSVRDQIVKVMIDPAAAKVAERFHDKPLVEAAVQLALAGAYEAVGRNDLALPHAEKSLLIRRRELGSEHADTLISAGVVGELLRALGRSDEAALPLRSSLEGHRRVFGDDHEATIVAITRLAILRQSEGRFDEAEPLYREALQRSRRVLGNDHESTIMSMNNLGYVLRMQGKLGEAQPLVAETLERARRVLGANHRGTVRAIDNMGVLLSTQGRYAEADPLLSEGLELCRRVLGNDDPFTFDAISDMAELLMEQGKFDEAEPLVREVLERRRRVLGDNHPETLISWTNLGVFLRRQGNLVEAEEYTREALERIRRARGVQHPETLYAITNMGTLYMAQKRFDEAEPLFLEVLESCQQVLPPNHPLTPTAMYNLADLRQHQGRLEEAEQLYQQALERRYETLGEAHPYTIYVNHSLAVLLHEQGKHEQAEPLFRQVLAGYTLVFGPEHWQVGVAHRHLGRSLTVLGRYAEAETELVEAERILTAAQGLQKDRLQRLFEDFVALYEAREKEEPGNGYAAKAIPWRAKLSPTTVAAPPAASSGEKQVP